MAPKYPETITIDGRTFPARLTETRIVVEAPGDHSKLRGYLLESAYNLNRGLVLKVGRGHHAHIGSFVPSKASGSPAVQQRLDAWTFEIKCQAWAHQWNGWSNEGGRVLTAQRSKAQRALLDAARVERVNGGDSAVLEAAALVRTLGALTWQARTSASVAEEVLKAAPDGVPAYQLQWLRDCIEAAT